MGTSGSAVKVGKAWRVTPLLVLRELWQSDGPTGEIARRIGIGKTTALDRGQGIEPAPAFSRATEEVMKKKPKAETLDLKPISATQARKVLEDIDWLYENTSITTEARDALMQWVGGCGLRLTEEHRCCYYNCPEPGTIHVGVTGGDSHWICWVHYSKWNADRARFLAAGLPCAMEELGELLERDEE